MMPKLKSALVNFVAVSFAITLITSVALADSPTSNLPPKLIQQVNEIGLVLNGFFGKHTKSTLQNANSAIINEYVLSPLIEYQFVKTLPQNISTCRTSSGLPKILLPGGRSTPVACTQRLVTWIRDDLFQKLSIQRQALLIVFERLSTVFAGQYDDQTKAEFLADIISGLDTALSLREKQILHQRPILNPTQENLLNMLLRRLVQLQLTPENGVLLSWAVTKNGGGLVHRKNKDVAGYVSVESIVGLGCIVDEKSELIRTTCNVLADRFQENRPSIYFNEAQVVHSAIDTIEFIELPTNISPRFTVLPGTKITNSTLTNLAYGEFGPKSEIENVTLDLGLIQKWIPGLEIQVPVKFMLSADSKILNGRLSMQGYYSRTPYPEVIVDRNQVLNLENDGNYCDPEMKKITLSVRRTYNLKSTEDLRALCINP